MKRKNDYEIAERIPKPLTGMIAWSNELNSPAMYDGERWVRIVMPHFVFSMTDLKPEKYAEFTKWIETMVPMGNADKIAAAISTTINLSDVHQIADVYNNSLSDFLDEE